VFLIFHFFLRGATLIFFIVNLKDLAPSLNTGGPCCKGDQARINLIPCTPSKAPNSAHGAAKPGESFRAVGPATAKKLLG
jgi:hypothetical protein